MDSRKVRTHAHAYAKDPESRCVQQTEAAERQFDDVLTFAISLEMCIYRTRNS